MRKLVAKLLTLVELMVVVPPMTMTNTPDQEIGEGEERNLVVLPIDMMWY